MVREVNGRPFVSVVIPCLNEEASIRECLDSVISQSYPIDNLEIIVADGGSTDNTLNIISSFASSHPTASIRVINNPERIQAVGCNRAIAESCGEVIVRMDAHAHYRHDYIAECVSALAKTGAETVGGAQRAIWRTPFQRAMAATLESPLAVGGAAYRNPLREGFVDTVWLGAFRRSAFERIGLFDPRAVTNEDAELNHRIAQTGGKVFLSRDIVAHYYPRNSLRALARQYFRYGIGRARTSLKHRRLLSLRPLGPFGLVLTLLFLGLAALVSVEAETALVIVSSTYLASLALEASRIGIRRGLYLMPDAMAILATIHFAWGSGFLVGLIRYALRPDWKQEPVRLVSRHGDHGSTVS